MMGFKSFADRTSIDFTKGVTAVVGPNGSGKSNITDAIRWVLGEQSVKSLRGAKMEDIIFGGSDSRKPLNVAEVTITLDNEDGRLPIEYNEVSVTRRVYRSGDSDFFINKQSCRLKDIVDLFMDSGLGKEAFSIIGQGRVEEILSSKPEDRRGIFEEAAGVLKYKLRKKKAETKLNETQDNLHRVEDVIYELEGQIEPLKMQASIAKQYLELKEELEEVESALIVHEIEILHESWESLKEQLKENQEREIELSATLQSTEAKVVDNRDKIYALDESIQDLQEVLMLASNEVEKLEGQREVLKERKQNAAAYSKQLRERIDSLEESIRVNKGEVTKVNDSLQSLKNHVKSLQQSLKEKESGLAFDEKAIEESIEQVKGDYVEKLNQQASYRNELSMIKEQLNQQGARNERLDKENGKYLLARKELEERKQVLIQKHEKLNERLEKSREGFRLFQRNIETKKVEYDEKQSKLYKAYQFLQKTKSRKEMLESMQEDYTGFYQGVKEVLKAKDILGGVEGAIAELISVPKEYHAAMETALGAAMQHVVVSDEQSARNAIGYLKKNRFGRATFLPLSVIKEKHLPEGTRRTLGSHHAFVGIAKDLISVDEKYKTVIENLLGTVIVMKDLKGANELAGMLQYRYRFVTLDGDVVNPGGSMTGGAVKQASTSILSRQQELEEVVGKLPLMEKQTADLEEYVKELKVEITNLETVSIRKQDEGQQLRSEEQQMANEINGIEMEERVINDRLAIYDLEIDGFAKEQGRIEKRSLELEGLLEETAKSIITFDEEVQSLTRKKVEMQTTKDVLQKEVTDLKVAIAEKQQILQNEQEKYNRLKQEGQDMQQGYAQAMEELALLQNQVQSSESGELTIDERITLKIQDKEKTLALITNRREERLHLGGEVETIEAELQDIKRQYSFLTTTLKEQEVQINRLDVELDNRLNHLQEIYSLSFEAAKEKYQLQLSVEDAKMKVKLAKLSIEELGVVNLGAIDEFERVEERHSFLQEQRNDLQHAKDTLHQVIIEMDEEMKKRFYEMFTSIRSHFHSVFQELFGGGKADLILTDKDDLLNTGIEIVAQPPGKKLQTLSLLSGGERALTAIALLFSILKVRPVPFCVLDEVEAALDEANVVRFAQYLRQISLESQFIIITHRKGTMEECDVLYGVTMQESGISKLVSVRLEEVS